MANLCVLVVRPRERRVAAARADPQKRLGVPRLLRQSPPRSSAASPTASPSGAGSPWPTRAWPALVDDDRGPRLHARTGARSPSWSPLRRTPAFRADLRRGQGSSTRQSFSRLDPRRSAQHRGGPRLDHRRPGQAPPRVQAPAHEGARTSCGSTTASWQGRITDYPKTTFVFAAKAATGLRAGQAGHPADQRCGAPGGGQPRSPATLSAVVFFENYDVSGAQRLIPATDLSRADLHGRDARPAAPAT